MKFSLDPFVLALLVCTFSANAQDSTNTAEMFKQCVADFQKSTDDQTLREKLVRFVATMNPKPEIPDEANRHFVKAATFMKEAKDKSEFELAINEYREALKIAPWWAVAYYNEGVALQAVGKFDQAVADFKLYLLTDPDDAAAVKTRLYSIEAEKELAAKHADDEAAKAREAEQARQRALLGRWYSVSSGGSISSEYLIEISGLPGNYSATKSWVTRGNESQTSFGSVGTHSVGSQTIHNISGFEVKGHHIVFKDTQEFDTLVDGNVNGWTEFIREYNLTLSEDGKKLTGTQSSYKSRASANTWRANESVGERYRSPAEEVQAVHRNSE